MFISLIHFCMQIGLVLIKIAACRLAAADNAAVHYFYS